MSKVALLISGLPRLWKPCLATQLGAFGEHQVDVFFHFWDVISEAEKEDIVALTHPVAHKFDEPMDFSAFDNDETIRADLINVPSRMMSQYYSWKKVASLFEPYKADYEIAVRSRSDLQFVYSLDKVVPQLKKNELLLNWWQEGKTVSDLFAMGDPEVVYYYHTLYDCLAKYKEQVAFNPEALLTRHLEQLPDLRVHAESFKFFFVRRPHMENYTVEQCLLENPGCNKWLDPEIVGEHANFHAAKKGDAGREYVEHFRSRQIMALNGERELLHQKNK